MKLRFIKLVLREKFKLQLKFREITIFGMKLFEENANSK